MKHISKLVLVFSLLFSSALFVSTVNATETNESDADITSACVNIPIKLQYQSRDTSATQYVTLLQDFLNDKGYLPTQSTGFFGAGTLRAVKAFQRANGISQTGALGPLTRGKIRDMTCSGNETTMPVTQTCNSAQSLVNGVCVTMTRTCPDGRVLAVSRSCDTSVSAPSAPNFTVAGMSSTRVKVVNPEESMIMNWNVPSASSYKIKVDMPNGDLQDKEYPTTLTTWTGSVKDLLGMTSGIVGLYIKACDASGICGEYSLPVSIVVKSSVTTNTQTTVANQVPVVTIKATPVSLLDTTFKRYLILTWTATNNPTYCTTSDGENTWSNGSLFAYGQTVDTTHIDLPGVAASYNKVIDLGGSSNVESLKFSISCTNAFGTSQIASVNTNPQTMFGKDRPEMDNRATVYDSQTGTWSLPVGAIDAYYHSFDNNSAYYPANWPAAWKKFGAVKPLVDNAGYQIAPGAVSRLYGSDGYSMIGMIGDPSGGELKICKTYLNVYPMAVTTSNSSSAACTLDSDFVPLRNQTNWLANDPIRGRSNFFSRSLDAIPGETTHSTNSGGIGEPRLLVLKAANGGIFGGHWGDFGDIK